LMNCSLNMQ